MAHRRRLRRPAVSDQGSEPLVHDTQYGQTRELLTNGEFNAGDAVFLYVTRHGQSEQGVHWVVLKGSEPCKLPLKSPGTAELIRWLAAYRDLSPWWSSSTCATPAT
jgi:hypothetical protein